MAARTVHPFPARMAPSIALDVMGSSSHARLRVLDPMCGSGTVLTTAARCGHEAIGFDLDPLAVLMSQVATDPTSPSELTDAARAIVRSAKQSRARSPLWSDQETRDFASFWFGETQQLSLLRLSRCIAERNAGALTRMLQLALSRIIVTKMPAASLASDTSHSRPHRTVTSSTYDVYAGFLRSCADLTRLLENTSLTGRANAMPGDARLLPVRNGTIDLVVTSPPYLNAIDYLRGHRLSLIWLGHTVASLRSIRSASIGAERGYEHADCQAEKIVGEISRSVASPSALPRSIVLRYAQDMIHLGRELYRVCAPGATVVCVVGNSTLRGNFIRNDVVVERALSDAGFRDFGLRTRDLPQSKRYLPLGEATGRSTIDNRMRTETVLTCKKAPAAS